MHKIQRPFLVRSRHRRSRRARAYQPFPLSPPDRQPRLAVHAVHPLVVHMHPLLLQLHLQAPISPPRLFPRCFHQTLAQRLIAPPARVPLTRFRHTHQLAEPPLAHQKMRVQPAHSLPALYELHPFFSITAFSMSLSRLRSATSFFSRWFSSSSCFSRWASPTLIPPYFAFHAYTVCLLTPSSRPTSAALRPASICFNAPIISTSLYFLFAMPPPLRKLRKSYTPLRGFRGAGHRDGLSFLPGHHPLGATLSGHACGSRCRTRSAHRRGQLQEPGLHLAASSRSTASQPSGDTFAARPRQHPWRGLLRVKGGRTCCINPQSKNFWPCAWNPWWKPGAASSRTKTPNNSA